MAIMRFEPFADIDRFFDEAFSARSRMGWDLATDVSESDGNVAVEMNIPGADPEKIQVHVEEEYMRITGSREEREEKKEKNYYSKEIKRGSFERTVHLPAPVDASGAKAEYKNGMLTVTMPKKERQASGGNVEITVR